MDARHIARDGRKTWLLTGAAVMVMLLGAGCGDAPAAGADPAAADVAQADEGGGNVPQVDACALLTDAEVSAMIGKQVTGVRTNAGCGWRTQADTPVSHLVLSVNPGEGDIEWDATALGEVGNQTFERVEGLGDEARQSEAWLLANARGYYIQLHLPLGGDDAQRRALTDFGRKVVEQL